MTDCIEWTGSKDKAGYGRMTRRTNGNQKNLKIHRVEWEKHHGPIPEGLSVMHLCDNPPCYNIDHLALGTHRANMLDSRRKGRQSNVKAKGEESGRSKLTEENVIDIKTRLAAGEKQLHIARLYRVNHMTIKSIQTGRTWGWLEA